MSNIEQKSAYQARDVANAPALRQAIAARSKARQDSAEVSAWLANHFYRWLVGLFPHATLVLNAEDYQRRSGQPAPDWLTRKLAQPGVLIFWIDPDHPRLLETEQRLCEFLNARAGTRLEGKLQRINCQQALSLWDSEHQQMQARKEQGWQPSSGAGLRPVLQTALGQFFEFDPASPALREEMAYESYHMRHCVGQFHDMDDLSGGYGEHYASQIERGELRLFTLRNQSNRPHITLSVQCDEDGLYLDQLKGKQNRPPVPRYSAICQQLLQHLNIIPRLHYDTLTLGLAPDDDGLRWVPLREINNTEQHLNALALHPALLTLWDDAHPALQWAALSSDAARDAELGSCRLAAPQRLSHALAGHPAQAQPHDPDWLQGWLTNTELALEIDGIRLPSLKAWQEVGA